MRSSWKAPHLGLGAVVRRGILICLLPLACGADPVWPEGEGLRVLFIGNSLTYFNDLPGMLGQLALADDRPLETQDLSVGGFSLEDHWANEWTRNVVYDGGWDVVILQQGPSSLPESRENLITWAGMWADAIRAQGGDPALYMVWPERARMDYFDDVALSYRMAAEATDALLFPVGEAWLAAWDKDATLPLYGADDFHPSEMGTYLAALTIYRGLTGRTPPSLSVDGVTSRIDGILHDAAQRAADGVALQRVTR